MGEQFLGDVLHQEVIRVLEGQLNVVLLKRSSIWSPISNAITWFLFEVQELGIRLKQNPLSCSSSPGKGYVKNTCTLFNTKSENRD